MRRSDGTAALAGLAAQGFTLASTLLPIAFGDADALVLVVTAGALATVVTPALTMAAQHRLPVLDSVARVRSSVRAVATLAPIGASGVLLATFLILQLSQTPNPLQLAALIAGIALTQSLFLYSLSLLTREDRPTILLAARLLYGVTLFLATLAVALAGGSGEAYCVATIAAYLVVLLCLGIWRVHSIASVLSAPVMTFIRDTRDELIDSRMLVVSTSLGTLGGQVGALVTPTLGQFATSWAVAIRLMSGFQTLGSQTVGPLVDVRVARSLRARDHSAFSRQVRTANFLGLVIGVGFVFACALALALTDALPRSGELVPFIAGAILFCGTGVALTPSARILGLAGKPSARLAWDSFRFAGGAAILLIPSATLQLWSLAALGLAIYVAYLSIVRRAIRALET